MSCVKKISTEIDINAPADKLYKVFKHELSNLPNFCSKLIQKVEVHEGDWDNHGHGSIKIWNYTIDGKAEVFKEQVEYDDKNMTATVIGLEGDVFNIYKTFNSIYQVVTKGPNNCSVILTLEYEKHQHTSPCPHNYLQLLKSIIHNIQSHLN